MGDALENSQAQCMSLERGVSLQGLHWGAGELRQPTEDSGEGALLGVWTWGPRIEKEPGRRYTHFAGGGVSQSPQAFLARLCPSPWPAPG